MKLINTHYIKIGVVVLALLFATSIFLGLTTIQKNNISFLSQKKFNYSGFYSLYIEVDDGLKFNWITEKSDKGFYELLKPGNSIIVKGETISGKIHHTNIDYEIKDDLVFRFGSINDTINEVRLKPIPSIQKSVYKNVDSLYIIGDVHGRYNQLINLLQKSNIIDHDLNWIAGKAHLVFLGDLFDRGYDVTKVLWFIYSLEQKAEDYGGKIHLVLGNHEIMTMVKDLRYLSPKEKVIANAFDTGYNDMFHPTKSYLGAWLSSKPSVLKIDNAILAHGGIIDLETNSIEKFNEQANSYIKDPLFLEMMIDDHNRTKLEHDKWETIRDFFYDENSPFWYRGYVYSDTLSPQLDKMLKKYKSKIHVIAHTPLETITQKYDGKLLTTDLNNAATQLLLLVRKDKSYSRFKIDNSGNIVELQ